MPDNIDFSTSNRLVRESGTVDKRTLLSYLRHCADEPDALHSIASLRETQPHLFPRHTARRGR